MTLQLLHSEFPYKLGKFDFLFPVVGCGGSLMTHSADYVTTQSKAFKFVMASEPHLIFNVKQVMAVLPYIKIYFLKTLITMKVTVFELSLNFS